MKTAIFAALLLLSGASQAALLAWGCTPTTHDTNEKPLTVPVTYKVYWGTTPSTRLHNEQPLNCTNPTSIEVPGPPGVMHYLAVRAEIVKTDGAALSDYSNGLNLQSVAAAPPPVKVDCVVSAWSDWTVTPWAPAVCAGNGQARQETHTRTIITQPSGGGAACPVLSETRTVTQPCTVPVLLTVGGDVWLASPNYTNFTWKLGATVGTIAPKIKCDGTRRIGDKHYRVVGPIIWSAAKKNYVVAECALQ